MKRESQIERADWLLKRREGIGGSDIAAILGLSPWATAVDVYVEKTSQDPPSLDPPSESAHWGSLLEDVVAQEYGRRMLGPQERLQRVRAILRHPDVSYARASIDRAVIHAGQRASVTREGLLRGATSLVEVKTASERASVEWGTDDDPRIPTHYAAQGMWYLGVTGLPVIRFAALLGGQRLVSRELHFSLDAWEDMLEAAVRFWTLHVQRRIPPEPTTAAQVRTLWPQHAPGKRLDIAQAPEIAEALDALRDLRPQLAEAKEREKALVDRITSAMQDAELLVDGERVLCTFRAARDCMTTDWQAVADDLRAAYDVPKEKFAEILNSHTTATPGSRRFLVKPVSTLATLSITHTDAS